MLESLAQTLMNSYTLCQESLYLSPTEGKDHTLLLHSSILVSKVILFNLTSFQLVTEQIINPSLKKENNSTPLPYPEPFQHKCIKRMHHLKPVFLSSCDPWKPNKFQNICAYLTSSRSTSHSHSAACFHPVTRQWRQDSGYSTLKHVFLKYKSV